MRLVHCSHALAGPDGAVLMACANIDGAWRAADHV
jgi:hypothetical protein